MSHSHNEHGVGVSDRVFITDEAMLKSLLIIFNALSLDFTAFIPLFN